MFVRPGLELVLLLLIERSKVLLAVVGVISVLEGGVLGRVYVSVLAVVYQVLVDVWGNYLVGVCVVGLVLGHHV